MKTKTNVTLYFCDHCNKHYLKRSACERHEREICNRNPRNKVLCMDCKHHVGKDIDDQNTVSWCEAYGRELQGRFEARHGLLEEYQTAMPSKSEGCPHHNEVDTLEKVGFTSHEFYGS
jgi:hypothetical protein